MGVGSATQDAPTGALGELAAAVTGAKAGDPLAAVTVVAPSGYASVFARRALAASDGGVANVTCTTVDGLVRAVGIPALAARGQRLAPVAVDSEAIRTEALASGGRLAGVVGHPRTLTALQSALAELRRGDAHTLEMLARRGGLAGELSHLAGAVRARLHEHGLADVGDLAAAARGVALGSPAASAPLGPIVRFDLPELAPAESAVLDALAARNGGRHVAPAPGTPACTTVTSCADPDEEVRAVVDGILRGLEDGAALWQHAVVHPAGLGYGRIVHQQLAASGVTVNGPEQQRLDRSMTGHCLMGLLELAEGRWARDELVAWLACAPIRVGPDDATVPATRWDAVSAEAGVVRGAGQWRDRLGRLAAAGGHQADAAAALARFVEELIIRCVPSARTWEAHTRWALALLDHYLPVGGDEPGWDPGEVTAAEQVRGVLRGLAALDAVSGPADAAAFRRAVRAELERTTLDTQDLDAGGVGDGVFVGPLRDVRGMRFASTFAVGLADANVPGMPTEDALLPDDVCALDRSGALRTRTMRRAALHQELRAALATGTVDRVATFPRSDPRTGRAHLPSRWLEELTGATTTWIERASFTASLRSPGPAATRGERVLRAIAAEVDAGRDAADAPAALVEPRLAVGLEAVRRRGGRAFTRFDGAVGIGTVTPFDPDAPVSATRFETYAACPRRYLLGRVLGIERRTRPEELWAIEPIERGTLLHAVLEAYVLERLSGVPRSLERLLAIAEERFAEADAAGLGGKPLLWRLEKAAMRRDLRTLYVEEGDLQPLAAELAFGIDSESAQPAIVVPVTGGLEVRFRGSADRVDRTSDGQLVVSDYKTGRQGGLTKLSKDPLAGGTRLQLPLYAMAARARFGGEGPVLARYWLVSGERHAPRYAVPLTDAVERRFRTVVGTIAAGVAAGAFPGVPGQMSWRGFDACTYCEFDPVCPTTREREWTRKREDPLVRAVVELREGAVPDDVQTAISTDLLPDEVEDLG